MTMQRTPKTLRGKTMAVLAAGLLVAACEGDGGGGGGGFGSGNGNGNGSPSGIASLGPSFVKAFNAPRNSQPVDAQAVTLVLTPLLAPFNP